MSVHIASCRVKTGQCDSQIRRQSVGITVFHTCGLLKTALIKCVRRVAVSLPDGIGVYLIQLPGLHLLPDAQQLLIQTNRIITLPPPLHLHSLPLSFPFIHSNKKITNLFTAL